MIPAIGYMIGFYILARGIEMIVTPRTLGRQIVMLLTSLGMMAITALILFSLLNAELRGISGLR
jgi:hypothetical protein